MKHFLILINFTTKQKKTKNIETEIINLQKEQKKKQKERKKNLRK